MAKKPLISTPAGTKTRRFGASFFTAHIGPLTLIAALAVVFAASPALSAPKETRAGALRQDQIFRAIYPSSPASLDPHGPLDPAAWPIIMACYHRLVNLEAGTAKPAPSLAKVIRVSPDGLKYTFFLNEGLTFSDGMAVNSEAVFFSFDRLMSSEVGRQYYPHLQRFEVLGPYSFRLILSRPWPPFLASLALPPASIISPGLRQRPPSYLDARTLGSGDYTVYDWKDETIGIQQRPELPARHKVGFAMFHFEPDPRKRYEKMAAHDAHLAINPHIPPEGLTDRLRSISVSGFGARYLAFNTRRAYNRMQNTRRAMSAIIKDAFKNEPGHMEDVFPVGLFHDSPHRSAPPEVGRTDQLTQAGLVIRDVGPPQAPLVLLFRSGDASLARDADLIIRALAPYGFKIKPQALGGAQLRKTLEAGDYDFYLDARQVDIPSADMWLGRFLDPAASVDSNPAFFQNSRAGQLVVEINTLAGRGGDGPQELAAVERDRAVKLAELAEIARTEAPYVFLYQPQHHMVIDERLANQRPHPMWPELWPLDQSDLTPLNFRSGANPRGRRPAPEPAPPQASPSAPENTVPSAPENTAPPATADEAPNASIDDSPPSAIRLESENPTPDYDDFIGMDMEQ